MGYRTTYGYCRFTVWLCIRYCIRVTKVKNEDSKICAGTDGFSAGRGLERVRFFDPVFAYERHRRPELDLKIEQLPGKALPEILQ